MRRSVSLLPAHYPTLPSSRRAHVAHPSVLALFLVPKRPSEAWVNGTRSALGFSPRIPRAALRPIPCGSLEPILPCTASSRPGGLDLTQARSTSMTTMP